MASVGRGGFKKRYILVALVIFLGVLLFRYQLPEPLSSFGIAVVEGLEKIAFWIGRRLAL